MYVYGAKHEYVKKKFARCTQTKEVHVYSLERWYKKRPNMQKFNSELYLEEQLY